MRPSRRASSAATAIERRASSPLTPSACASSSSPEMMASGVRSSWLTSATSWRSLASARRSRASVASSGRKRAPDRHVARQPDQHERERRAQPQDAPQLGERLVAVLERRAGEDPVPVPADVDGGGLDPRAVGLERLRAGLLEGVEVDLLAGLVVHVDADAVEPDVQPVAGGPPPLARAEHRPRRQARRGEREASVRRDHLGERLARVVDPRREPLAHLAALDQQPRDRRRARLELLVERVLEPGGERRVDHEPDGEQRHRRGHEEGGRDAQPQAHGPMR